MSNATITEIGQPCDTVLQTIIRAAGTQFICPRLQHHTLGNPSELRTARFTITYLERDDREGQQHELDRFVEHVKATGLVADAWTDTLPGLFTGGYPLHLLHFRLV